MTIAQRLTWLIGVSLTGLLVTAVTNIFETERVYEAANFANASTVPGILALNDAVVGIGRLRARTYRHVLAESPAARLNIERTVTEARTAVQLALRDYATRPTEEEDQRLLIAEASALRAYLASEDAVLEASRAGQRELALERMAAQTSLWNRVLERLQDHIEYNGARGKSVATRAVGAMRVAATVGIGMLLAVAAGLGYLGWTTQRHVRRRLEQATRMAERISGGDLAPDPELDQGGHDEVGRLLNALDRMRSELARVIGELAEGKEHLEAQVQLRTAELKVAKEAAEGTSRAMLSALPDLMLRISAAGTVLEFRQPASQRTDGSGEAPLPAFGSPDPQHATGGHLDDLLGPAAGARLLHLIDQALASGELQRAEFTLEAEGRDRHFEARIAPLDTDEGLAVIRDISERKRAEQQIRTLAYRDPLTGMMNRHAILEALTETLRQRDQEPVPMAVMFIDLDGFKRVNDTLGHVAGDKLLKAVADRLRDSTRAEDLVTASGGDSLLARLGGDEFTIVMPSAQRPEQALAVAHRLKEVLHRPFTIGDHEVTVSASIGIAMFPEDGTDSADLLKCADTAMYHAKESGRDKCKLYSAALTTRITQRVTLENSLRRALERGEFHLVYQPQVLHPEGRPIGMEALIRWQHPERGLVPPLDFIPIAEESGLIVPIGEWVLRTACAQAQAWRQLGLPPVRMAVNLSAVQFKSERLLGGILAILQQSGMAPDLLDLELTESTLMDNADGTIESLQALRAAGIHLTIDDFGTGYSSMSYLKRFPVRALKIDRSFVCDLPQDRENAAIVQAICAMATSLGLEVVAEGIETADQAEELAEYGCHIMQGYRFARPMTAVTATQWLQAAPGSLLLPRDARATA